MVISEDTFRKYLVARAEGQFNMYMEGRACAQAYGIPLVQYCYIMQNFGELRQKFTGLEEEVDQEVFQRLHGKDSSKKYGFSKSGKYGPIYFVRGDAKNERGVRYALSLIGVQAETWTYNINGVGFMPIEDGYLYFGYRGSRLMRVPIDQQSWLPQIIMDTAIELQPTPPERIPSHFFEDTEEE